MKEWWAKRSWWPSLKISLRTFLSISSELIHITHQHNMVNKLQLLWWYGLFSKSPMGHCPPGPPTHFNRVHWERWDIFWCHDANVLINSWTQLFSRGILHLSQFHNIYLFLLFRKSGWKFFSPRNDFRCEMKYFLSSKEIIFTHQRKFSLLRLLRESPLSSSVALFSFP